MSFTEDVKHELTHLVSKDTVSQLAELSALIRMDGSIQIINHHLAVKIRLFHGDLARRVFSLIKDRFGFSIEIIVRKYKHFSRKNIYELIITSQPGVKDFLIELGFLNNNNDIVFQIKKDYLEERKLAQAYLRGAFLGGGSVNSPRSEYHLEFRCEHKSQAEDLAKLLEIFDLEAHLTEHKGKHVVYFKSHAGVITVLNIIGAHQALLEMENSQIVKEMKNNVNRRVNCETANLDKVVQAAMDQLKFIAIIEKKEGLDSLTPGLQEIAKFRKENPYASLKELGEMVGLSKSGVNHRLRRIKKIAEELGGR